MFPGIFASALSFLKFHLLHLPPSSLLDSQRRPPLQSPCGVVVVFPPLGSVSRGFDPLLFCPKQKHGCLSRGGFRGHTHISGGFRGHTCARRKLRFIVKDSKGQAGSRFAGSGLWYACTVRCSSFRGEKTTVKHLNAFENEGFW